MILQVRLSPNARESRIEAPQADGALKIRVAAKPVENAANKELIRLLARALKIPQSAVRIRRGATSKTKTVEIDGVSTLPGDLYGKAF